MRTIELLPASIPVILAGVALAAVAKRRYDVYGWCFLGFAIHFSIMAAIDLRRDVPAALIDLLVAVASVLVWWRNRRRVAEDRETRRKLAAAAAEERASVDRELFERGHAIAKRIDGDANALVSLGQPEADVIPLRQLAKGAREHANRYAPKSDSRLARTDDERGSR